MASPASVGKHPIHPMLIPFPIALWIFSLICDLIYVMGWGGIVWKETAFYTMAGNHRRSRCRHPRIPRLPDDYRSCHPENRPVAYGD